MWERTLKDLIRGLRANKQDEGKFIAKAVDEIRSEIRSDDMELKAAAVLKLTYLDMLGYDMSWASFHVVEVMSSPRFHLKSVGYLAAVQSFNQETDVLMLTTNLLKKDLGSNPSDVAVTLNGISQIVTPDLARDVVPELVSMLNHSRPHIRKRAILAIYKVFSQYPEAIPSGIGRLKEKLQDPDPAVIAATVNVLCELARRDPDEYLPLAPQLFHLLTTSSNNWMLIKIIKLFAYLSPHEPRLAKKLHGPITDLISTTPAISLLYECVKTCIIGGLLRGSSGDSLARLCVSKLAGFLQDADQNLKYIALLATIKIVPEYPHLIAEHQDTILASITDQDISIRMRALDLISAMVNRSNLQSIAQHILTHLATAGDTPRSTAMQTLTSAVNNEKVHLLPSQSNSYRMALAQRLLLMCSSSTYENVVNFEWYLSVLVDLAHVAKVDVGLQIRDHLVDVVGRVRSVRPYAVNIMYSLLREESYLVNATEPGSCAEVLWAAAFICGEYASEMDQPQKMLPYLLQPGIDNLAPETVAVYIQAAVKIFGMWTASIAQYWNEDYVEEVETVVESMLTQFRIHASSSDIEVQERAASSLHLFTFIQADLSAHKAHRGSFSNVDDETGLANAEESLAFPKSMYLIQPLSASYSLNTIAPTAQERVPVPDGLDLDAWIVAPPAPLPVVVEKPKKTRKGKEKESGEKSKSKKKGTRERQDHENGAPGFVDEYTETAEERAEREKLKAERLERQRDDPYYILDDRQSTLPRVEDIDSIPIVRLDDMPMPKRSAEPALRSLRDHYSQPVVPVEVDRVGEMPPGAIAPKVAQNSPSAISGGASRSVTPSSSSLFPAYDVEGVDVPRTSTPEPIKVVRAKKKKKPVAAPMS